MRRSTCSASTSAIAHGKDLDHGGDAGHLAAGTGKLDYARYVAFLCGLPVRRTDHPARAFRATGA